MRFTARRGLAVFIFTRDNKMRKIEAYQSMDGTVHLSERAALAADDDCLGEAIDALLTNAVAACNGNVTRSDQHRMALYLHKNRAELAAHVALLNKYLNIGGDE